MIARRLVKLDNIALINISAGKRIVPELIQGDASAVNITREAEKYLTDEKYTLNTIRELNEVTDELAAEKYLTDEKYTLNTIRELNEVTDKLAQTGASARVAESVMRIKNGSKDSGKGTRPPGVIISMSGCMHHRWGRSKCLVFYWIG